MLKKTPLQIKLGKIFYLIETEGFSEFEKLLKLGFEINTQDEEGRTLLMYAILSKKQNLEIISHLLELGADPNIHDKDEEWTALHFAARDNNVDLTKLLLSHKAEVDKPDTFGNSPLLRSVFNCKDDLETVKLILSHGANPHKKNKFNVSPFIVSEQKGRQDLIEILKKTI